MTQSLWNSPGHVRHMLSNDIAGSKFALAALRSIPAHLQDEWWDEVFNGPVQLEGLIVEDREDLPRGCVPYLPCPVATVLAAAELLQLDPSDVLIEVGSGLGRAASLFHFLTGAAVIGVEVQKHLAESANALSRDLKRTRQVTVHGDARDLLRYLPIGTAYFFYCPFGSVRLGHAFSELESRARIRRIRICLVDMPAIDVPWLVQLEGSHQPHHSVRIYESIGQMVHSGHR